MLLGLWDARMPWCGFVPVLEGTGALCAALLHPLLRGALASSGIEGGVRLSPRSGPAFPSQDDGEGTH